MRKLMFSLLLVVFVCRLCAAAAAGQGKVDLSSAKAKLAKLKAETDSAKKEGIDTSYEKITILTADLFLNKFIPWDAANAETLAQAYSLWEHKEDLKGTPQAEAVRTPKWELAQTNEILDSAIAELNRVRRRPESRRPIPKINSAHLTVADGFLSSDGQPVFSGGFIWAPMDMDEAFYRVIGGGVWLTLGSLAEDGTVSPQRISDIKNTLDALQAKGQKTTITLGQNVPRWAVSKWPDIDDYKGHFFGYDIDHPQVKPMWRKLLGSLGPAVTEHTSTFNYQLAGEPVWPTVGTWVVNNASPHTYKRYRSRLKKLYGNIGALNKCWGTGYSGFGDIKARPKDDSNRAEWYDWCRFNQWRVNDFFRFLRDEIHKYDPDALCNIKVSVGSVSVGIGATWGGTNHYTDGHYGIDREALVDMTEINGLDNFLCPQYGRSTCRHHLEDTEAYSTLWPGHSIVLDFIRSLGPDKLIYDSEWHSVSSVYYIDPEPSAGYMRAALWQGTLHGMGATRTWYWSRRSDGSPVPRCLNEYYGSLLVQPRTLNEYGRGLAELNAFGPEVVALERQPRQIRLLYSEPSSIQSIDYLDSQLIAYEALYFTGIPIGFVTENDLQTTGLPADCKWLVVADTRYVKKATLDWLNNYVNGGGKLLVIGDNALKFNEYGAPYSSSQRSFIDDADKLDVVAPPKLHGQIEALMSKTGVNRPIRCVDSGGDTAFGVMCRSAEYRGGRLICLINVAAKPMNVSLELAGRIVTKATDLLENKSVDVRTISLEPLAIRLLRVNE